MELKALYLLISESLKNFQPVFMLDAQKGKKVLGDRQGKRVKRGNLVAGRRQGKKDFILNPLSIGSDNWDFI